MPQDTEDQSATRPDFQRYFDLVRRRHILFLVPLFLGWAAVWSASWVLPARYKSSTLILVEQPTMPKDFVAPNITDDLQDRMRSITQQILSRTRLLVIIDKLDLYGNLDKRLSPDEKIERMRKDIDIELVRDPERDEISSFRISYSAKNPHVAQSVTGELTSLFINENSRERQEESEGTTKFLSDQLETARASLAEQEAKVREFQGMHEGQLPTQQASNLQILSGIQAQLENEQSALNGARQQHVYLQALVEQSRTLHGGSRRSDSAAGSVAAPTDLQSIDDELDKLRAQLADLSSRYTDRYPDVLKLKTQIAKMESMRDSVVAASKQKANDAKQAGPAAADSDTLDPSSSGASLQLQSQLQANQMEIANRERSISDLKAKIGDYQTRLNAEPATEQGLADLTRGYEQSKANYDELLKKKEDSEIATSMEHMQAGERFTILDPPSLPAKPDFPNRLKFCAMGLGVGLALGVVVVGGFELTDGRLYSEQQIKSMLPMLVISEVPEVVNAKDTRNRKRRLVLGWVITAIVAVIILSGTVFSYLHA
jgi:succinoglycan biosynthesis transport protein ExoP